MPTVETTIRPPMIFIGACAPGEKKNTADPPMPSIGSRLIIQSSPPDRGSSGGVTNSTGSSGTAGDRPARGA